MFAIQAWIRPPNDQNKRNFETLSWDKNRVNDEIRTRGAKKVEQKEKMTE